MGIAQGQLRSAIAQVGGKKELTGRTDIEIAISNQCARVDRECDHLLQLRHPVADAPIVDRDIQSNLNIAAGGKFAGRVGYLQFR